MTPIPKEMYSGIFLHFPLKRKKKRRAGLLWRLEGALGKKPGNNMGGVLIKWREERACKPVETTSNSDLQGWAKGGF